MADANRYELEHDVSSDHPFSGAHVHKSRKTLFGVALLIVASLLFYELGGKAAGDVASSPVGGQRVAHATHR